MSDLTGRVVAITGASSGIGRATALEFARAGCDVSACARRVDRLRELVREIESIGRRGLAVEADVDRESDVRRFVDETVRVFGRLDVMVNNAGYGVRGTVEQTPGADFEALMRTNYLGTVYGCQAALRHMRARGSGVVINVSSIVGFRSLPNGAAYAATKAAQISLTESLRVELDGTGIHAVSVHPIVTRTEFAEVARRKSGDRPGRPLGPSQSAEHVARRIVASARRPRAEVHPSAISRLLSVANAVSPALVDAWAKGVARGARAKA
jgi:NAD(P)-dependent dehydrogenase (short-subunit alcohol dehydrogenase family)